MRTLDILGIENLQIQIEYYGSHENFYYANGNNWKVEGDTARSVNGAGDIFEIRKAVTQGVTVYKPSIKIRKKGGYGSVLRFIVSGEIARAPEYVLFNEADEVPVRNKALYGMGSGANTFRLIKDQWVNGVEFVAYRSQGYSGVVGVAGYDHYFTCVRLNENGQFCVDSYPNEHWLKLNTVTLCEGEEVLLDSFVLLEEKGEDALLTYGRHIGALHGVTGKKKALSGWCSWYYYGANISEEKILENTTIVRREKLPFNVIQIDDGWQVCNGTWEANERFSGGMRSLADKINAAGFIAGIWVAPFLFDKDCALVKEHADWFIFANNRIYIDYSREPAQKWLFSLFHKLSHEWGYRYIKVDLVQSNLATDGYAQAGFNGLNNLRKGYEIIRRAVTEDTYILACTTPLGGVAGQADAVRCSIDIFEMWDSLKNVAIRALKRLYLNGYARIDPDCLLVRTSDKQDGECFRLCTRTEREIETFITFLSVCGGNVMISDKLSLLDERDFSKIRALFPLNDQPCRVSDLFDSAIPCAFAYGEKDGEHAYAFINWTDKAKTFTPDTMGKRYSYRFWAKKEEPAGGSFQITLPPHGSEIVYFSNDKKSGDRHSVSIVGE